MLIYFQLFGPLSVLLPGQQEPVYRFRTRATGALLGFLACHPGIPHERETLIEMFWPNQPLATGRNNLSLALSFLRRTLGEPPVEGGMESSGGGPLRTDRHTVTLDPEYFETDVTRFEHALEAAAATAMDPTANPAAIHAHLNRAIVLYRGDLLHSFDEEWILGERLRLRERYLFALREMVIRNVAMGNISAALDAAHRAVAEEPVNENHHIALMELYLQAGQPERTVAQFQNLRRTLRRLDGSEPTQQSRLLSRMARQQMRLPRRTPVIASPSLPGSTDARAAAAAALSSGKVSPLSPEAPPPSSAAAAHALRTEPALPLLHPPFPAPLTRFFGRQQEYGYLLHLLDRDGERLVTLTGPGGIGKTRLAREAAAHFQPDGMPAPAWFVPLADVADLPSLVNALEEALGQPQGAGDFSERLQSCAAYLSRWSTSLLILDGLDRLLHSDAGADGVRSVVILLLGAAGTLRCLATSRQPLGMAGERRIVLGPLGTAGVQDYGGEDEAIEPHPGRSVSLTHEPAFALFVDRARSVAPKTRFTRDCASQIATLCRRLGGNPLAIELAAGWAGEMNCDQLLQTLTEAPGRLLSARYRDLPEQHRSLEACFNESWEGLAPPLQRLLRRMTIFAGPFTDEAVIAVCSETEDGSPDRCRQQLAALCDRSLLVTIPAPAAARREPMRFAIPEEFRFCVRERFVQDGGAAEREEIQRRFVAYYLKVAEHSASHLLAWEAPHHLRRLDTKQINIRAALTICLREGWDAALSAEAAERRQIRPIRPSYRDLGLRLCLALRRYWMLRGHTHEGLRYLSALLGDVPDGAGGSDVAAPEEATASSALLRRDALLAAVDMASYCHLSREAYAYASRSLTSGVPSDGSAEAFAALCTLRRSRDIAPTQVADVIRLILKVSDAERMANLLEQIGEFAGEYGEGVLLSLLALQHSLSIRQQMDDMYGVARLLATLGRRYLFLGYTAAAESLLREATAVSERLDDALCTAGALRSLAAAARLRGRLPEAIDLLRRSLRLLDGLGMEGERAETLLEMATVHSAEGHRDRALRLAEDALQIRYRSGAAPVNLVVAHLIRGELLRQDGDLLAAGVEMHQAERQIGSNGAAAARAVLQLLRGQLTVSAPEMFPDALPAEQTLQSALAASAGASRLDLVIEVTEALGMAAAAAGTAGSDGTDDATYGLALLAASAVLRDAVQWPCPVDRTAACAAAAAALRASTTTSEANALWQRGAAAGRAAAAAMVRLDDDMMDWLRFDMARWGDSAPPASALREGTPLGDALIHAAERGWDERAAGGGLLALGEVLRLAPASDSVSC